MAETSEGKLDQTFEENRNVDRSDLVKRHSNTTLSLPTTNIAREEKMTYYWKAKPVFFVSLATIFFGFFVVIKPSASLILLQSFPNSSLWRERYLDNRQHKQGQEDFYEILGVSRDANQENIKIAFRQLVKVSILVYYLVLSYVVFPLTNH